MPAYAAPAMGAYHAALTRWQQGRRPLMQVAEYRHCAVCHDLDMPVAVPTAFFPRVRKAVLLVHEAVSFVVLVRRAKRVCLHFAAATPGPGRKLAALPRHAVEDLSACC